jgi:hypothetical protein
MPSSVQSKRQQTLHDAIAFFNALQFDHARIKGLASVRSALEFFDNEGYRTLDIHST